MAKLNAIKHSEAMAKRDMLQAEPSMHVLARANSRKKNVLAPKQSKYCNAQPAFLTLLPTGG